MAQIYNWNAQGFRDSYEKYVYKQKGCGAKHVRSCVCNGKLATYTRQYFTSMKLFEVRAQRILQHFELAKGSRILVAGCALGFLMEELQKLGMVVYGFDSSNYIQQLVKDPKNPEKVKFPIYDIDLASINFVQEIQNATGHTTFDCIITEDVLPSFNNFTQIINNCDAVSQNVFHIVDLDCGEVFTNKTIEEWILVNPLHTWANYEGVVLNANN